MTCSSATRTCRRHPGVTWNMVKSQNNRRVVRKPSFSLCQVMSVAVDLPSDDMPDLQEVEEDQRSPGLFHVGSGVSHQEFSRSSSTNWLAELANIATSPQSPLLKNAPHKRCDAYIRARLTQRRVDNTWNTLWFYSAKQNRDVTLNLTS